MFPRKAPFSEPVCTVRRHPDGGYTPVLHLSDQAPPAADPDGISMPSPADAQRYARDHYGTLCNLVHDECATSRAPSAAA